MSEVLIKADNISKKFCRNLKKSLWYGLIDLKDELMGNYTDQQVKQLREGEFWVNKNISFEVKRGECLGLIGKNGAGKSTLLKILTGLIKPDTGRIELRGRIGALIELGAGFNPILTGRENVFSNGAILGFSQKEMEEKYDDIVAFAELEEFMDTPIQYYSSGMKVRLGFAIASTIEPDILILDEVLAVGDAAFRAKCYNRIGQLKQKAALIFVSHSMQQVSQICTAVLAMEKGNIKWLGDVGGGIAAYNSNNSSAEEDRKEATLVIEHPVLSAALQFQPSSLNFGEYLTVRLNMSLSAPVEGACIRIAFFNAEGLIVSEWNGKRLGHQLNLQEGENAVAIKVGPLNLRAGSYKIGFIVNDSTGVYVLYWSYKEYVINVVGNHTGVCEYQLPAAEDYPVQI
jgi:lipopolysaccharide transport system ATP-binding protein